MQHMQLHCQLCNYVAASFSKFFEAKLIRLEQIWLDSSNIWADLIKFGQSQNLASPKMSISYGYVKVSFIPRQYTWDDKHEHEHRK